MSTHSAVLVTTNQSHSNGENQVLQYLSSQLTKLNITIKESCKLINDDKNLVEFIEKWHNNCDLIFLSGKQQFICNTFSKIYNEPLVVSNHLASIYNINTENSGDSEHIKLPNSSEIYQIQIYANGINPVLIKYKNNIVLPNDLNSIKAIMDNLIRPFLCNNMSNERYVKHLVFNCNQDDPELNQLIHNVNQSVNIKRYCAIQNGKCELNIILTSSNFNDLAHCEKKINEMMPNSTAVKQLVKGIFWNDLQLVINRDYVKEAMCVIEDCFTRYNPKDVFLSFNGGKDCTVLLYLTLHVLKTLHPDYKEPLLSLYIKSPNPFGEVEDFIEQCRQFYNLKLVTINSFVKIGLDKLLTEQPHFKACLMGTRRTDPYSQHLKHFQMTDPCWPQIMRVNPILDWKYSDIWNFLLTCNVPYCVLYDMGYTSLGSRTNTGPNPSLRIVDEVTKVEKYLPAYKLQNGAEERSGRLQK